jgi:phosphoglucosamine mutase
MIGSEDDGISMWNTDGTAFSDVQISSLVSSVEKVGLPGYGSVGRMSDHEGAVSKHKDAIKKRLGHADCPVVLDCPPDSASLMLPSLLTELGCDVMSMHSAVSGDTRKNDPDSRIHDLQETVKRNRSEIGIAMNSDGTKTYLIDETGTRVDGGTVLAILVKYLAPKKVVVPINTSMMIDDIVRGEVVRVTAGVRATGEAVAGSNADLGGLPSGHFIFPELTYCPDGVFTAALLAKIAGENRLRDIIDSLPEYSSSETSVKYGGKAADISKRIDERVSALDYQRLNTTDGWRVEMDSGWYLIRFSAKEPVIRITAEARDKVYMNCLVDIAKDLVSQALK